MGEMQERLKGFFGLQTKPKIVTPEGVGVNVKPFTPPTHFDQAKVMDRPTMPPTQPSTPDSAGTHQNNGHKGRKLVAGVVVAAAGTGGYLGYNALQNSGETTTTAPVTTVVDVTTPPLTSPETTTITVPGTTEAPTTTVQEKPTDVVEHREGYDVLRNGGLKYELASEPWFGGFELHLQDGQESYGFNPEGNAQEVVLNGLLDAFGGQHPEFRNPDGSVNRDAYKAYLESNNGIDSVSIPENISPQDNDMSYPPVTASEPLQLDLSKDVVFVGGNFSFYDADFADIQYYRHTPDSFTHAFMGVTTEGQLYIGVLTKNQQGITKNEFSSYDVSVALPALFSVTANITSLNNVDNPQLNWQQPFWNTIMPFGTIPSNLYTPGLATSNILDYGDFKTAESKIFSQV